MTSKSLKQIVSAAVGLSAVSSLISLYWGTYTALGVLAGCVWNTINLILLVQGLNTWFDMNDRRMDYVPRGRFYKIGLFLAKFPVLYGCAILLLMSPDISKVGFGIGFTIIIVAAMIGSGVYFQSLVEEPAPHGR